MKASKIIVMLAILSSLFVASSASAWFGSSVVHHAEDIGKSTIHIVTHPKEVGDVVLHYATHPKQLYNTLKDFCTKSCGGAATCTGVAVKLLGPETSFAANRAEKAALKFTAVQVCNAAKK